MSRDGIVLPPSKRSLANTVLIIKTLSSIKGYFFEFHPPVPISRLALSGVLVSPSINPTGAGDPSGNGGIPQAEGEGSGSRAAAAQVCAVIFCTQGKPTTLAVFFPTAPSRLRLQTVLSRLEVQRFKFTREVKATRKFGMLSHTSKRPARVATEIYARDRTVLAINSSVALSGCVNAVDAQCQCQPPPYLAPVTIPPQTTQILCS